MASTHDRRWFPPRRLTLAGGILLGAGVSGVMWSVVAFGAHLAGAF